MKRTIAIILISAMGFTTPVYADIFPSLTKSVTETDTQLAPSYSGVACVEPAEILPYTEGGTVAKYDDVDLDGYKAFGDYLEGQGFEVTASEVDEDMGIVQLMLSNDMYNIGMIYDANSEEMQLIYEAGVSFEKPDPFDGYTHVYLGDQIEVRGLGTFCFNESNIGEEINLHAKFDKRKKCNAYVKFSYYNKSDQGKKFGDGINDLFSFSLEYINADGRYSYEAGGDVDCRAYGPIMDGTNDISTTAFSVVPSLESGDREIAFNLPSGLIHSSDGTIGLTVTFKNEDQDNYVLILRENGVNHY